MGFTCGVIGLPNVGKSTIFNALSSAGAEMANYPFCTVEPNRGIAPVPDRRLPRIAEILGKSGPIPTKIEFIDVAGLVRGASKGEGLGNRFLGHIRNVDALVHVVRCFDAPDVVHVSGRVDAVGDARTVDTELLLADLEVLERARDSHLKAAKAGDRREKRHADILSRCIAHLDAGAPLKTLDLASDEMSFLDSLGLITDKPVLFCANIDENNSYPEEVEKLAAHAESGGAAFLVIAGKLEEEISELPESEKQEFLESIGLEESGLARLIQASYGLLDLITYYTTATLLQAWTLKRGTRAVDAAGRIHTDFQRGFIRAEVYGFEDLVEAGSEHAIRQAGRLRSEGKEYVIRDGDVVHYLFNP
jgi:GTP-binding protein YchF